MAKEQNNTHFSKKDKYKIKQKRLTNEMILEKLNFSFTRDAEWFKKTNEKIEQVKLELDKKFYTPEKKAQKIDFIRRLRNKLKDYKDALNFAEKYRKIRFFERRKLERMLTKINKEIANYEKSNTKEGTPDYDEKIKEMNKKKDNIVRDINYVKFYPKSWKYYSLFPNNDKDNPETLKKIQKMRRKIDFYLNKRSKAKERELSDSSEEEEDEVEADMEVEVDQNENEVEKENNTKSNPDDNDDNDTEKEINPKPKSEPKVKVKKEKTSKKKHKADPLDYEKEGSKKHKRHEKIEEDDFFIMD